MMKNSHQLPISSIEEKYMNWCWIISHDFQSQETENLQEMDRGDDELKRHNLYWNSRGSMMKRKGKTKKIHTERKNKKTKRRSKPFLSNHYREMTPLFWTRNPTQTNPCFLDFSSSIYSIVKGTESAWKVMKEYSSVSSNKPLQERMVNHKCLHTLEIGE
jgi:uncharacterized protein YcbK (DUF882 family)